MAAVDFHLFIGKQQGTEQIISTDGRCEITVFNLQHAAMLHRCGRIYLYGELPQRYFGFELPENPDLDMVSQALVWYSNTYFDGKIILLVAMPAALLN